MSEDTTTLDELDTIDSEPKEVGDTPECWKEQKLVPQEQSERNRLDRSGINEGANEYEGIPEIVTKEGSANYMSPVGFHAPRVAKPLTGIGDLVVLSAVPENYYKYFHKKLVDTNKSWIFDYNPYVIRNVETHSNVFGKAFPHTHFFVPHEDGGYVPAADMVNDHFLEDKNTILSSKQQIFCEKFGIKRISCRGPRLYRYEDPSLVKKDQVVIHAHGDSTEERIDDNVIKHIKERYASYKLIQVGGNDDPDLGIIDRRGLNWWAVVELIATSAIFIGVNSGPMNIANCYPHINKKLIINTKQNAYNETMVEAFYPLATQIAGSMGWMDYGWQYYNDTEFDLGATYSYEKI